MNVFQKAILAMAVAGVSTTTVFAQYPTISPEAQAASDAERRENNRQYAAHRAAAQQAMKEWESKGKPYIPWAATPADLPQAAVPAFPGAEGGGAWSFGGRGGKVYVVTNLNDSGPGSFREACEAGGPRIVVFNVSGIIPLKEKISIRAPYITINGATAPGDGVCIAGNTVELDSHDIIIRHMRFRRGAMDVTERNDSIGGNPIGNVMIDHVSASWGLDENMSMYRHMYEHDNDSSTPSLKLPTVNITIQNSIFSEGLNTFNHAFGSTIGGYNSTFHHNLWACNSGRNPSVGMNGDFGFVNNVVFNWLHRTTDGGDHLSYYNIINNYYKPGPATPAGDIRHRILKPEARRGKDSPVQFGKAYVGGNIVEGNERVTKDNWDGGVQPDTQNVQEVLSQVRVNEPLPIAKITTTSAQEAYEQVLANAGATLPKRDAVDARVVEMVRSGKPTAQVLENSRKEVDNPPYNAETVDKILALVPKGIITNPAQVGGHPEYKGEPFKDADNDGMWDEWETQNGLNPNDASDSSGDLDGDGYTNIEELLNGTNPKAAENVAKN